VEQHFLTRVLFPVILKVPILMKRRNRNVFNGRVSRYLSSIGTPCNTNTHTHSHSQPGCSPHSSPHTHSLRKDKAEWVFLRDPNLSITNAQGALCKSMGLPDRWKSTLKVPPLRLIVTTRDPGVWGAPRIGPCGRRYATWKKRDLQGGVQGQQRQVFSVLECYSLQGALWGFETLQTVT